jgi:transcriptional regulator with XRE-family HTH domain
VPAFDEAAKEQLAALGEFIRHQRLSAEMSLRDLAARTNVSNPYLSQIERGMHEPSVRVLKAIAGALNLSAETLLAQAGLLEDDGVDANGTPKMSVPDAIAADDDLTAEQRTALLAVYHSYVSETRAKKP